MQAMQGDLRDVQNLFNFANTDGKSSRMWARRFEEHVRNTMEKHNVSFTDQAAVAVRVARAKLELQSLVAERLEARAADVDEVFATALKAFHAAQQDVIQAVWSLVDAPTSATSAGINVDGVDAPAAATQKRTDATFEEHAWGLHLSFNTDAVPPERFEEFIGVWRLPLLNERTSVSARSQKSMQVPSRGWCRYARTLNRNSPAGR